jgi:hypothetical protein
MKTMINLLPVSYRRQQIVHKRAMQWGSIVCLVLLAGWAWHWQEMRKNRVLTQKLEVLTREQAPTQTMLKQLVDMRRQLEDLQQQEIVAKELESQRNALKLLGVISQGAQKTKGRLRVTKLELSNFQGAAAGQAAATTGTPANALIITGESLDNPAVATLLDGLQDSGLFSRVDFTLKERPDIAASLRDYEVRCDF